MALIRILPRKCIKLSDLAHWGARHYTRSPGQEIPRQCFVVGNILVVRTERILNKIYPIAYLLNSLFWTTSPNPKQRRPRTTKHFRKPEPERFFFAGELMNCFSRHLVAPSPNITGTVGKLLRQPDIDSRVTYSILGCRLSNSTRKT